MHEFQRKYRPTTLKEIVGQPSAVKMLQQFVKRKAVPHALLFEGPPGTGKTTAARIMAGLVGATGSDLVEVNAASSRGIDHIREIQLKCSQGTFEPDSTSRVWVFDEAHQLSKRQGGDAQTAMLKTIEEPPTGVYFFLCSSEPHHLLKAIQSRCTRVVLKPIPHKDLVGLVTEVAASEEFVVEAVVATKIAEVASGSGRDALKLLDQIAGVVGQDARLDFLSRADSEVESIRLCRELCSPRSKWVDVAKILKGVEEEPEKLRRMILGYFTAVALGNSPLVPLAAYILEVFRDHYYDCGKAGLVANCYEVTTHKSKSKK